MHEVCGSVNKNDKQFIVLHAERGLGIGIPWNTWICRKDDREALLDYVLIDRHAKEKLMDLNVFY